MRNNKGVSLVEILFSIVILSIVAVALLKTSALSMKANVRDDTRNSAIAIASERMNEITSLSYTDQTSPATLDALLAATGGWVDDPAAPNNIVWRTIGNVPVRFTRLRNVADISTGGTGMAGAKQISISVSWLYSGQTFTYGISSIKKRTK